jgi:hypothetical protein
MKRFILILLLYVLSINATSAQGVRGCLVANVLYTQPSGKGLDYFDRSPGNFTSKCGFYRVGNTSNCRLYNSGPKELESSYSFYADAASSGWAEVANCPVDDQILMLSVAVLLVSILKVNGNWQLLTDDNNEKV